MRLLSRCLITTATTGLLFTGMGSLAHAADDDRSYTTWSSYLGTPDSAQYSALKQINRSNVHQLQVAWTYPTGEGTLFRFGPLVVNGVMYVLTGSRSIVALDAATGKEIWTHRNEGRVGDRGMSYWESADKSDRRLLYLNEGLLTAIDARTGNIIASFGDNGHVDLKVGLNRDITKMQPLQTGNPGRVFENLIIMSLPAAGGLAYRANPGDVHAYDVRTGELKWTFHSVPGPGEFGADTWPESALANGGGVHNWNESTLDERRGIIYIPFGTARFDFYGGNRHGDNLFANSLVAIDARTGKRLWHFQTIHHDVWDYDLPAAPKLLTIRHDGRTVDVVAQPTKHGFVFVFDRVSGAPVWPIEERPVPQTDVPGEQTSKTQPFPTAPPPFARQSFTEQDINPYMPEAEQKVLRESTAKLPERRVVHTTQHPRVGPGAGMERRRQLGEFRGEPSQRHDVRRLEGVPVVPEDLSSGGSSSCGTRGHGRAANVASAQRGTGFRGVPLTLRVDVVRVERAAVDRAALVPAHRLRPQQGHDPVADSKRRGRWRAEPHWDANGEPGAARRPGRNRRRVAVRCDGF